MYYIINNNMYLIRSATNTLNGVTYKLFSTQPCFEPTLHIVSMMYME